MELPQLEEDVVEESPDLVVLQTKMEGMGVQEAEQLMVEPLELEQLHKVMQAETIMYQEAIPVLEEVEELVLWGKTVMKLLQLLTVEMEEMV
jgi:hypothetical protein